MSPKIAMMVNSSTPSRMNHGDLQAAFIIETQYLPEHAELDPHIEEHEYTEESI